MTDADQLRAEALLHHRRRSMLAHRRRRCCSGCSIAGRSNSCAKAACWAARSCLPSLYLHGGGAARVRAPLADAAPAVKRFWKQVDGRAGRRDPRSTASRCARPGACRSTLPTAALAEAIAAEWRAVGRDDRSARDAADRARQRRDRPDRARSGGASPPASPLMARATCSITAPRARTAGRAPAGEHWDPLLDWARGRYDVHFETDHRGDASRPAPRDGRAAGRGGGGARRVPAWPACRR